MSLEIRAELICDGCGKRIAGHVEHRSTRAMRSMWECKRIADQAGWTTINRGRFHTQTHWCQECSNKPMKPVPRKPRAVKETT